MTEGYFNPLPLIAHGDEAIPSIENLIRAQKVAVTDTRRRNSFSPPNQVQLDVKTVLSGDILRIHQSKDTIGLITVTMFHNNEVVRQGHFNRKDWHHNPSGQNIPPPHHIHFPTLKFPRIGRANRDGHSYAYQVDSDRDMTSTLKCFCINNNISLQNAQYRVI
ncbi:hypothetical protein [Dehalogenimonas alkenigignens]|uniref:hypothetical protein n=1 Tax=Dehalogenimonas alkenigignens TaxID=1217799 RepID=UPI000D5837EA|nr:hypothetical protein [Dehalogenimonas alkenigignens]PVV83531.1 hypothetical protein DD509_06790 [Dehalogenimonas alkenigignens]